MLIAKMAGTPLISPIMWCMTVVTVVLEITELALIIFGLEKKSKIVFLFEYPFSLHLCVNSGRLPFSLQRRVILLVNDYSVGTERFDLDRDIFGSGKCHMIGRSLSISDWLFEIQG